MKILVEEIDGDFYIDVILSLKDYRNLGDGLMEISEKKQDKTTYCVGVLIEKKENF